MYTVGDFVVISLLALGNLRETEIAEVYSVMVLLPFNSPHRHLNLKIAPKSHRVKVFYQRKREIYHKIRRPRPIQLKIPPSLKLVDLTVIGITIPLDIPECI